MVTTAQPAQTSAPQGYGPPPVTYRPLPPKRRQKLIESATPLLPPGTEIRHCFAAETKSPWIFVAMALPLALIPAALVFMLINRNRVIAVTDDAIYVLDCGRASVYRPKRVLTVLPRATMFGPLVGLFPKIVAGSETLYVATAFRGEVAAANAGAVGASSVVTSDVTTGGIAPVAPVAPVVVYPMAAKSKVTAGLLAIFLGSFGAHKFYLGQTGIGIAYLLLCWTLVPLLVGIVEGLVYLTLSDEQFAKRCGNGPGQRRFF